MAAKKDGSYSAQSRSASGSISTPTRALSSNTADPPQVVSTTTLGVISVAPPLVASQLTVPQDIEDPPAMREAHKSSVSDKIYSIELGFGSIFRYTEADFIEPPSLNGWVSSPEALFSIWDDTTTAWKGCSPLTIQSTPIAVQYWQAFYQHFSDRLCWQSYKQNWYTYRVRLHSIDLSAQPHVALSRS